MQLNIDAKNKTVSFTLPRSVYGIDSLRIAAAVFDKRAEVSLSESAKEYEVELLARRTLDSAALEALAREFGNELLNQEYRFIVGRFNRRVSDLIVAQSLLAARGGEHPASAPAAEKTPEFQAEVKAMMAEAAAEIKRTMPKKLPPQGSPIPPEKAHA